VLVSLAVAAVTLVSASAAEIRSPRQDKKKETTAAAVKRHRRAAENLGIDLEVQLRLLFISD